MALVEKLKAINSRKPVKITLPEIDLDIYVKSISAAEREEYCDQMLEREKGKDTFRQSGWRAWVLQRTICDENGKREFTDKTICEFMDLAPEIVEYALQQALEVSKLLGNPAEEAEKNSESSPNVDSTSS